MSDSLAVCSETGWLVYLGNRMDLDNSSFRKVQVRCQTYWHAEVRTAFAS